MIATPRNYAATLRSLLRDAEALDETHADGADGALHRLIVENLADALDANAGILRFKSYLVTSAIGPLLLSVLLILPHNPSGLGFPQFVYRFFDKLFRLDQAH